MYSLQQGQNQIPKFSFTKTKVVIHHLVIILKKKSQLLHIKSGQGFKTIIMAPISAPKSPNPPLRKEIEEEIGTVHQGCSQGITKFILFQL